jgi:outer membrane protein
MIGIPSILYSDAGYDMTDEVMAEINKDRPATPATSPAATGTAPAATPPAASTAKSPSVSVPGLAPKK